MRTDAGSHGPQTANYQISYLFLVPHRRLCSRLAFVATFCVSGVSLAQSSGDFAARTALVLTPVGALPPIMTSTIASDAQTNAMVSLRYGYLPSLGDGSSINNAGATLIFPAGLRSTVSLTGGFFAPTCDECNNGLVLGVAGDTRLGDMAFGTRRERSRITFGFNGELGYARSFHSSSSDGSLVSAAIGLPIGLVSGGRARDAIRVVPFLTPGFGFGAIRQGDSGGNDLSGTRFMLGGGLGLYSRSSTVALTVGFQYVQFPDADPQIGVALTFGR